MAFVLEDEPAQRFVIEGDAPVEKQSSMVKDVVGGAAKGIGNIGATIAQPFQYLAGGRLGNNAEMRRNMGANLQNMGIDTESVPFKVGEIGSEIIATAPVGGLLGAGASKLGLPMLSNALKSGGMSLGGTTGNVVKDLALRGAGGAAVGGASAGLVNPDDAASGAVIGAAAPAAIKLAGTLGKLPMKAAKTILGGSTGVGSDAISTAYQAGKNGSTAFLDNMRGNSSFDDVVDMAKQGLTNMRIQRGNEYRSGMLDISKDKSVLDFAPIDNAVKSVQNMGSYKGVQINKNASGVVDDIVGKVNEWKSLPPGEFHTPEGLDALKQAIGDIRDTTQPNTAARRAADNVYNSIKDQIVSQAPVYSKVMKDYSDASKSLNEIEKSLSLGSKASVDTSVRKLQSVLRNNAQTNYGNRLYNLDQLQSQGGVDLLPSLAGQSMNSWMPRGMVGAIEKAGAVPGAIVAAKFAPPALLAAPFASPRLVGEAAYKLGSLNRNVGNVASMAAKPLLPNRIGGLLDVPPANYLPLAILSSQTSQQ